MNRSIRRLASASALVICLAFGAIANAQQAQCQPSGRYCNSLAGSAVFQDVPGTCPVGTQVAMSVCEALVPRAGFQTAGTAQIRPGQQYVVQAVPGPTVVQRTVVRQDPRYRLINGRLVVAEENIQTLDHNAAVDRARNALAFAGQNALNEVFINNDRVLAQRINTVRDNGTWQVNDMRSEWRFEVTGVGLFRNQFGGSQNGAGGLGFGILHYPQGSDIGVRVGGAFYPLASQPLVPAPTPLFTASASVDVVFFRGIFQPFVGVGGSGAFRFGHAGNGEVRGGTMWDLHVRLGARIRAPFYPTTRPQGPAFLLQPALTIGGGQNQALVSTGPQEPMGASVGGIVDIGASF